MTEKRPHKRIFLGAAEKIAQLAAPYGFVDHPIYETGWEPCNQEYSRFLIREDATRHIDQFEISYMPAHRNFFVSVKRSRSTPALIELLNLNVDAGDWSDAISGAPYEVFWLSPGARWRLFSRYPFMLRARELDNPDAAISRIVQAYESCAERLFKALDGQYQGWNISVDHYDFSNRPAMTNTRAGRL